MPTITYCQAEDAHTVGIPGVDGLPGDDHTELVACGEPATTAVTYREPDEGWDRNTTEWLCDEHVSAVRWAAGAGLLHIVHEDRFTD